MKPDSTLEVTYRNPVIPGFYSDPSVCRVGEDYYLVTSTFEYFPGVPVFHSKDLIHWEQIGHVIHRKEQIPKDLNIFAPTLRYNNGVFYMITTNVSTRGNFFVTANHPSGPWSDPVWIDVSGIDPDLFFDDDGRVYVVNSNFELVEINVETGTLIGERRKIWNSTGGRYPEAPHLYKKDGFYYLMAAEGGTEEAHSVTIARSHSIWGPYIDNPGNPIVAHAHVAGMGNPIQGVGHADMVLAHDGNWWMVLHGYRSVTGYPPHHTLGRETCLVPVSWVKGGWPVVNGNGTVGVEMTHPTLPQHTFDSKPVRTSFKEELGLEWNYIQPFNETNFKLNHKTGTLTLKGSPLEIGEKGNPTFIGRRITDIKFSSSTRLQFDPKNDNEEAGMTLQNNDTHFDLMISSKAGQRYLVVKLRFGQTIYHSNQIDLAPGPVDLKIEGTGPEFIFSYAQDGKDFQVIEKADARFLSTETVGWFTGVYVGLYATGNGKASKAEASYEWFEYSGK
ncbi:glycoside hydrolase family 43 protein [Flexithrix dorotheae]|uniref:glycoside hydrolase family 43 protein n=1 Tax=Flexithrix dorotheae TaxID=70993 RepID=UPI00039F5CB3|nr:glycoside hydrolase family 43 protein [Flexithrix dorotheae]